MTHSRSLAGSLAHGAVAGVIGAGCMTLLRMVAHRARVLDQMVPQAVETWVTARHGLFRSRAPLGLPARHLVDQLLHFGYGASWGKLYGFLQARGVPNSPTTVTLFGVTQWAFGALVLFPALGIGKPAWEQDARENVVNVAAHLLYAGVTAFLVEEFARQERDQPRTYWGSRRARLA